MKQDPTLRQYFADIYEKERLPDRAYFYNVFNSIYPDYLRQVIQHANTQRNQLNP